MVSVCANCKGLQSHLNPPRGLDPPEPTRGPLPHPHPHPHPHPQPTPWVNTTLPSLRRSASGGCRPCALLLQGLLLHHDRFAGVDEHLVRLSAESYIAPDADQDHLSLELRWTQPCPDTSPGHDHSHDPGREPEHDAQEGYPDLKLEFFTDQAAPSSFPAIGPGRHIPESPLHGTGLASIRSMVQSCSTNHSKCRPAQVTMPKRLLDLQSYGDSTAKDVRLHETDFNAEQYCTLTYSYGSSGDIIKTTRNTLQRHKHNIPWSDLPKTFQDAVALTRSLGIRWLWIDSLCIVQDDAEEKLEESCRLDEIFGSSFLTIAATSASNSTDGLFLPRIQPFKIQAINSKGSMSKVYVREQPSHYSFKASFDEEAHMNDWEIPFNTSPAANRHTPLLTRAWTYCERLTSPRVLHFTKSEMILECREGYQCECGRIDNSLFDPRPTDSVKQEFARVIAEAEDCGLNLAHKVDNRIDRADSLASQLAATSLEEPKQSLNSVRDDALQLWSYIVTEYTARDLTSDEDRLLAITGVAKKLRHILRSGYIAGQWTYSTLGLLWYPNNDVKCRRSHCDAPSWSWASVEGSPISFDNATAMDLACSATFASENGGQPAWLPNKGDVLEISTAMAAEVTFVINSSSKSSPYSLSKNAVSVDFTPDVSPTRGIDEIKSGETLVCVLVSMTYRSSIIGLVLKRSTTDARLYRRVGRFECYDCRRSNSDDVLDDAESLFGYWFPEVEDMTQLDDSPRQKFLIS